MKTKTIKLFCRVIIGTFLLSLIFFQSVLAENYENIPGQDKTSDFITYVENVYKFGIAIVAVLALFMIVLGGFNYIVTSAGNASKVSDAKDMILKAIEGLVLALASYLLLFVINPDLIGNTIGGAESVKTKEDVYKGTDCKGDSKYLGYKKACNEDKCQDESKISEKIDFSSAPEKNFDKSCSSDKDLIKLFDQYGGSKKNECLLMVIADIESNCGQNNTKSSAGACGIMQMLPKTAKELDSSLKSKTDDEVCELLTEDNDLSIRLAAEYINKNSQNKISKTLAGYNGGYGTAEKDGKKPPLASSSDCSGSLAFECCVNPGELDQSIAYAWDGVGLYKMCNKDVKKEDL